MPIAMIVCCCLGLAVFETQFVALAAGSDLRSNGLSDDAAIVAEIAKDLLDDSLAFDEREAAVARRPDLSGAVIGAMTQGLSDDLDEEYRRIPWIWRVAIAAGKGDDSEIHHQVLVAALPEADQPLTHWQAVVLGGGLINGWSLAGRWPASEIKNRLAQQPELQARWERALELAATMTDKEEVPSGTRYDALRMIALAGWEQQGERLGKYLQQGIHDELQMGAISGTSDIDSYEATTALLSGLSWYSEGNRRLALEAMLRTEGRSNALLDGVERGDIKRSWISGELSTSLKQHKSPAVAGRAVRMFP
jgi:hypothetical protein